MNDGIRMGFGSLGARVAPADMNVEIDVREALKKHGLRIGDPPPADLKRDAEKLVNAFGAAAVVQAAIEIARKRYDLARDNAIKAEDLLKQAIQAQQDQPRHPGA